MDNIVNPPAPPPPAPPPPPPPSAVASPMLFSGNRSDFRRLVMRGALLELITVGFYRFWLATDMRRHLWSNTSVAGDAPEYTGTAKELFIGFLFAMAILLPLYLVYFIIGLEAERMQAFASIPLLLFFYFFTQFAIYRARRYRLTRTIWRGVRFGMGGSGWNYAWRAGLWTLFAALTLGVALPWRAAALERFKMRYTAYGDLPGRFDGTGWGLLKRIWWIWLTILLVILPGLAAALVHEPEGGEPIIALSPSATAIVVAAAFLLPFGLMFAMPFLYAIYKAIEWRWWVSGVAFGELRFHSGLRNGALIGLYWKVIGWSFLLFVLLAAFVGGVTGLAWMTSQSTASTPEKLLEISNQLGVWVPVTIGYIVAALAFVMVMRIYLVRDVWQRVAGTTSVHNLAAAGNVSARGQMAGALGEGFADSLDVAGF